MAGLFADDHYVDADVEMVMQAAVDQTQVEDADVEDVDVADENEVYEVSISKCKYGLLSIKNSLQ